MTNPSPERGPQFRRLRIDATDTTRNEDEDWWLECVEEGAYEATTEGLTAFIDDHLHTSCLGIEKEAKHQGAIKAQALGEGLQAHRLEKLNRYETPPRPQVRAHFADAAEAERAPA